MNGSWKSYSRIISLIFLIFNSLLEFFQLLYSIYQIYKENDENLYFFSKKNLIECLTYLLVTISIFLDYNQIYLVLSSVAILFSYTVFIIKMDKFSFFGKYIRVIGEIIKKASGLFIIIILLLFAFCLSFKNLEKNFSTDQDDYVSFFNSSFELGLFKTFTMMIGSLETENMGIDKINSFSFINYIIYGAFIYFMSILLLNIFTGISIDEVSELFKTAERDDSLHKIDYIIKIEKFKKIRILGFFVKKMDHFMTKITDFFTKNMDKYSSNENILKKYGKKDKNLKTKQKFTFRFVSKFVSNFIGNEQNLNKKEIGKKDEKIVSEGEKKILYELTQLNIKVEKLFDKSLELEKKNNSLEEILFNDEKYFEKKLEKKKARESS